ncbi:MAG: transposase, partial [Burkholderiaceae bacterium]|nr:transposase [Burkholderiaceae bacterium]
MAALKTVWEGALSHVVKLGMPQFLELLGWKVLQRTLRVCSKSFPIADTTGMRKKYPSDITREQFEQIAPLLEGLRKKTRPPTVDLYEVLCAVLYLLKSGCQWRMLPEGFPKWRTVHAYFT